METRFGPEHVTTDAREVIDSPDIDLVVVLTAMPGNGRLALATLVVGKHVLGALVRRGSGDVEAVPSRRHRSCPFWAGGYSWSGTTWDSWYCAAGGGSLFDLGVYNVTKLTGLLGPLPFIALACVMVHRLVTIAVQSP